MHSSRIQAALVTETEIDQSTQLQISEWDVLVISGPLIAFQTTVQVLFTSYKCGISYNITALI
jgi:enhancing lycopene biosynthesis protein 2